MRKETPITKVNDTVKIRCKHQWDRTTKVTKCKICGLTFTEDQLYYTCTNPRSVYNLNERYYGNI